MRSFATFHPAVLFTYYMIVILITMFFIHPVILSLSLFGSLLFHAMLTSRNKLWKDIVFYSFVLLLIALTNPLFVHKGETILFFLNSKPVTLEAVLYGIVIASMLVAVIFWSKSYSLLFTTDKFLYLFGKVIPKLALILSMAFRFIPLFKQQIKEVHTVQKTLGLYTSDSIADRIMSGVRVFQSILTWSLENSVIQADAMKARGYGLPNRSNYTMFKLEKRDVFLTGICLLLFVIIMYAQVKGIYTFYFYPAISTLEITLHNIVYFIVILILMILPFMIEVKENLHWKLLEQKI